MSKICYAKGNYCIFTLVDTWQHWLSLATEVDVYSQKYSCGSKKKKIKMTQMVAGCFQFLSLKHLLLITTPVLASGTAA